MASCRKTRSLSAGAADVAYVRPLLSLNSTSKTSGASFSTTVPTWPRPRPRDGTSSKSATTSSVLMSNFLLLEHVTASQTGEILIRQDDPGASNHGTPAHRKA